MGQSLDHTSSGMVGQISSPWKEEMWAVAITSFRNVWTSKSRMADYCNQVSLCFLHARCWPAHNIVRWSSSFQITHRFLPEGVPRQLFNKAPSSGAPQRSSGFWKATLKDGICSSVAQCSWFSWFPFFFFWHLHSIYKRILNCNDPE